MANEARPCPYESLSPYQTPVASGTHGLTARGYTPSQSTLGFAGIGVFAGLVGGGCTGYLNSIYASVPVQLSPLGGALSVSLWLAIGLFIERLYPVRTILLLLGCLVGIAVTGIVYVNTVPTGWFNAQPLSWDLLRPYVVGAACGAAIITATLRLTGGAVSLQIMAFVFLTIWFVGAFAFFVVDEFGTRRRMFHEPTLAVGCTFVFVGVVLSMVGWQLAEANCDSKSIQS